MNQTTELQVPAAISDQSRRKLVSICVPVFNEQENVARLYERVRTIMDSVAGKYDFELLFTDNHSEDQTFEQLAQLSLSDPRVRVLRFSRNFGFQRSILTNFCNARGDAAIQLDCDLQDPPDLIPEFIRLWEQGYRVVYGVRRSRPKESPILHGARRLFYRIIDSLSEDHLPHDAGDFRLIDRCILDQLRLVRDQNPYLRGMIAAMGFRQVGVPYDRAHRAYGHSKFNFWRLLGLALDGILQHSIIPLRIATAIGAVMCALAVLGGSYYVIMKLFFRPYWPVGIATLYVLVLLSIGMNAVLLGIIGEYIGRIYKNVKRTPLTIIEATIDHTGTASPCPSVMRSKE